jgi:Protein of unknown function DUF262
MKAPEKSTVHDLLNAANRYKAPVYQRYYVWKEEELIALFDDIENATDSSVTEFIGAIVLQDIGKVASATSPTEYLIVDGQQRLTTLYLLLANLAALYKKHGKDKEAETIVYGYLTFGHGTYKGWPKVVPTVQDRTQLWDLLSKHLPDVEWEYGIDPGEPDSRRTGISDQWNRIHKMFESQFLSRSGKLLKKPLHVFQTNLLNYLDFVQITLEKDDDANVVFTKLNYRGQQLLLSE